MSKPQFTGLHDKNGRPIYEGDLVKTNDGKILEVFWNSIESGHWWFAEKKDSYREHVRKIDLDKLEVIGNVFENKDLLEVRHD